MLLKILIKAKRGLIIKIFPCQGGEETREAEEERETGDRGGKGRKGEEETEEKEERRKEAARGGKLNCSIHVT